jgi:hypothetical protein
MDIAHHHPFEVTMAKGQTRSNREIRKPKKSAAEKLAGKSASSVSAAFAKPSNFAKPNKK